MRQITYAINQLTPICTFLPRAFADGVEGTNLLLRAYISNPALNFLQANNNVLANYVNIFIYYCDATTAVVVYIPRTFVEIMEIPLRGVNLQQTQQQLQQTQQQLQQTQQQLQQTQQQLQQTQQQLQQTQQNLQLSQQQQQQTQQQCLEGAGFVVVAVCSLGIGALLPISLSTPLGVLLAGAFVLIDNKYINKTRSLTTTSLYIAGTISASWLCGVVILPPVVNLICQVPVLGGFTQRVLIEAARSLTQAAEK